MQPGAQTREQVWTAMAEHFLDTETRHRLPYTAWVCVEARLTTEAAYAIWCREIIPVVGFNLCDVAGEWAGWDDTWLIEQVRRRTRRRWGWPYLGVRKMVASDWNTLSGCIELLLREQDAAARLRQREALTVLAEHLVDFVPRELPTLSVEIRDAIRRLGPDTTWTLLSPCLLEQERPASRERLERAFLQLG